jgi:aspartate/methionine/tyrosine aminotransferase
MPIEFNTALNNPSYAITALQSKADAMIAAGHPLINATIGDPKDDTPMDIQDALRKSFNGTTFSQYPIHGGKPSLLTSISDWAKRHHQCTLDPARHVLACNGTKEALFSLPLVFDFTDRCVLIPSLSYPVYAHSVDYLGIESHSLPLRFDNGFLPDLAAIPPEILQRTQLFYFNSPHNPTTAVASRLYLNELLDLAEQYQFFVCSDEFYNELYDTEVPASVLDFDSPYWICTRSLSKRSHMTGYRSGAILSKNEELISKLKKLRSPMGVGTPSFIQDAAAWAWNDDAHVNALRELYKAKRKKLHAALKKANLEVFGGNTGFTMWIKSQEFESSELLSEWFLSKHILVTPGTVFGCDGNPYIRLVYCLKNDTLDELCDRLI